MSGSRTWSKFDKQELVVSRDIVKIKQKDNRGKNKQHYTFFGLTVIIIFLFVILETETEVHLVKHRYLSLKGVK